MTPCRLCGGALMKLKRVRGKGSVPVDAHPVEHGHIILLPPRRDDEHKALELTEEEAGVCRSLGRELYTDHWATCPDAREVRGAR